MSTLSGNARERKVIAVSGDRTLSLTDHRAFLNVTAAGLVTITLPAAASTPSGFTCVIQRNVASAANVAIGSPLSLTLTATDPVAELFCDGANWHNQKRTGGTPATHASTHAPGGSDALTTGTPGASAPGDSAATGTATSFARSDHVHSREAFGTSAGTVCQGNDSRLSDSRAPTAHAASHKSGGSDSIKLDELSAPTDVATLNVSTSAHGLCPKAPNDTAKFLRGDATWAAPTGGTIPHPQEFRLTLESGVPVSASDQTAKTTLYLTPCIGNQIALYDGSSAWTIIASAEVSLSLSGITSGTNYDIFAYNNSGTLTLEALAWTNDTTRATALTTQDGVLVKSGATTRRWIGTIRASAAGQCEDSLTKRFVCNCYNRVWRGLEKYESTSSWTYQSTTWRPWNNSTANRVEVVIGVYGVASIEFHCRTYGANGFGVIGLTADATSGTPHAIALSLVGGGAIAVCGVFTLSAGYHYIQAMERCYDANYLMTFEGAISDISKNGMCGCVET